ncbi:MAG: hypothetical protein ACRC2T_09380 [Thermoguttaceae bacterium]
MAQVKKLIFYWPEIILLFGLLLLNIGFFAGRVETVDTWCLYVAHILDIRYWTWRMFFIVFSVTIGLYGLWCRNYVLHIKAKRIWTIILTSLAVILIWRGLVECSWNITGVTFVIRQHPQNMKITSEYTPLDYKVHVPPGYFGLSGRWPLIIFLHGAGGVGKDVESDLEDLVNHLSPEMKKDFPFVVISPASGQHGWKTWQIRQIIAEAMVRWNIDPNRIYLSGMSMGGFGTFQIACDMPETFAAIVPVAGGGDPAKAECLKSVPTWAFHGDADNIVDYECSSNMIEAMKKTDCCEAKLTTLHRAGHDIMQQVYSRPDLYKWMLEQRKERKQQDDDATRK